MTRRVPFAAFIHLPAAALLVALPVVMQPAHAAPLDPEQQAVHVLNRLAYGPRPGDVERVRQLGVRRWVDEQLHPESIALPPTLRQRLDGLETVNRSAGVSLDEFLTLRKDVRDDDEGARQRRRLAEAKVAREAAEARLLRAVDSPRQLEEVMVDFWFNHFNVFSGKGITRALVTSYERDAIRPYALGSFRNLLGATARHPAMLFYLDNAVSKARGVNENYARELMELHTLGVDGGYTQKDVTELARMLTGWTFDQRRLARAGEGFRFDAKRHDAGAKTWLGETIAPAGQQEGEHALDVLARHPATARHLSRQLAQYFVSDDPPPALVERMARTWMDTGGDIRSVLKTLFDSSEFMSTEAVGAKFKTPYQFVVSAVRASAAPVANVGPLVSTMTQLGMPLYGCQTPDGYKNTQDAWLNPDALTRRITFATALASGRLPLAAVPATPQPARQPSMSNMAGSDAAMTISAEPATVPAAASASAPKMAALDPAVLQTTLDGAISPRTLDIVRQNPDNLRAAMLLGSPDFMQH
jgi:uncharacterized protein (DUF1800 family)